MSKLVIVESPNKIKSISKYLGSEYVVMASKGHIYKLPATGELRLGIDLENWIPKYKIDPLQKERVEELKKAAAEAEVVFIATDPDREGEAIGENLIEALQIKDKYKRIRFNEITKPALIKAIETPTLIDQALVNAQVTRRMLDRIIGFRLSSLMVKKIYNYPQRPSAGRVQSIALKLIVDKEKEIDKFIPVPYHTLKGQVNSVVFADYYDSSRKENKHWILPENLANIKQKVTGKLEVVEIKKTERNETKVTPFKQSALYKAADSQMGLSSAVTQSAAQKLYEGFEDGGLITYPRTDSTRLSDLFVKTAKVYIKDKYGQKYVSDTVKGSAGAQDAHEAIRPTSLELTPQEATEKFSLSSAEEKIYKLIYNRTAQALMNVPRRKIIRYNLMDNGVTFKMTSSKVIFDGYYILVAREDENELPIFTKGQLINIKDYIFEDKETKPPARYNEGSLIEKLDNIGVGRPSTYAATIKKIKEREYVEKDGKALKPTIFGNTAIEKLVTHFPGIINEDYTASIETELDEISESKRDFKETMSNFFDKFEKTLDSANQTMELTRLLPILVGEECPTDGGVLIYKRNRKGDKFIACANWPNCTYTRSVPNFRKRVFFKKGTKKAKK